MRHTKNLQDAYPELAQEWSLENGFSPSSVTPGSNIKVWWQCKACPDHKWMAAIYSRANTRNVGCPYCKGKKASSTNNLLSSYLEIAKEWDTEANGFGPQDCVPNSDKKVWWRCSRQPHHTWMARVANRTKHGRGCPICAGQKVDVNNSLIDLYPQLCREWDYSRNKIMPKEVLPKSNKKIWWKCIDDPQHQWESAPSTRVSAKTGCPFCKGSSGEKIIARILDELDVEYSRQYRFPKCKHKKTLPFDFAVHAGRLGVIEFHGMQHYQEVEFFGGSEKFDLRQKLDCIKREFCKKTGLDYLEIHYNDMNKIREIVKQFVESLK
jgi:hypothetical protein